MEIENQPRFLYQHLLDGNKITQYEAITKYGIGHLSSVVSKLVLGYDVPVAKESKKNANNKGMHTEYSMSPEDRKKLKDVPLSAVKDVMHPIFNKLNL